MSTADTVPRRRGRGVRSRNILRNVPTMVMCMPDTESICELPVSRKSVWILSGSRQRWPRRAACKRPASSPGRQRSSSRAQYRRRAGSARPGGMESWERA